MVALVILTYIIVAILIWYCIYIYRIKCYKKDLIGIVHLKRTMI